MIPTLNGRIQTRIFAIVVIGGLWTLLITMFLPGVPDGADASVLYKMTYSVLGTVLVIGIGWELVYHGLQQFRWEKDWPTLFGLITGINEGLLLWILLEAGAVPNADNVPARTWVTHFATTWILVWLWLNGPMKVVFHRWRVRGGSSSHGEGWELAGLPATRRDHEMTDEASVAVRIRAGDGLVVRAGIVVALLQLGEDDAQTVIETVRVAAADLPNDQTGRLLGMVRGVNVGDGGVAITVLGTDPVVVVRGSIECAIVTDAGTQPVQGGSAPQAIALPNDVRRLSLAAGTELPAPAPHSDLQSGAVPGGGVVVEFAVARDAAGMPLVAAAEETPVVLPAPPTPPAPPAPAAAPQPAAPPSFVAVLLQEPPPADDHAGHDHAAHDHVAHDHAAPLPVLEPAAGRTPLPIASVEAPPPPPEPGVPMVQGIGCALGHVNRLDARYCSSCGRRIQGTISLLNGPRPLLGLLVFDDGTTFSLDRGYIIGREPSIDPKVVQGQSRAMMLDDPERAVSRVHAEIVLDGWDTKIVDRGSANGTYVLTPGAGQWVGVSTDQPQALSDGTRVAVGRKVFTFEQR